MPNISTCLTYCARLLLSPPVIVRSRKTWSLTVRGNMNYGTSWTPTVIGQWGYGDCDGSGMQQGSGDKKCTRYSISCGDASWKVTIWKSVKHIGQAPAICFHAGFLLRLFFRPWRWRRYVPPKRRLTLNGLHGVISQKMALFITTAVITSNPTDGTVILRWEIA
jgi:hypothetical protein